MQLDRAKALSQRFLGLTFAAMTCLAQTPPDYLAGSLSKLNPQCIFSDNPEDAWNRIFYFLFTRTVQIRLAENFKEGAPFIPGWIVTLSQPVSTRIFERIESGDRAIDPLYPSFLNSAGPKSVLSDPQYQQFKRALQDAVSELPARPPLQRALMQVDAWAAFDILYRHREFSGELAARKNELLRMLSQLVRKLALTPAEIAALPKTYTAAQRSQGLPPLFDEMSGWIEVEWFPRREHDRSADYRRAARVFVRPMARPQQFLSSLTDLLRRNPGLSPDLKGELDAVALVIEDLLIDSNGRVEPSPLAVEVQIRRFAKDPQGKFKETTIAEYELSRWRLLHDPSSGGLSRIGPAEPAYFPVAGNDYGFASPAIDDTNTGVPVLGSLRLRCEACHGPQVDTMFTFSQVPLPKPWRPPAVRQLKPADDPHAEIVAQSKMQQADFRSLSWAR